MPLPFDATLKDLAQEPVGFLTIFDKAPSGQVSVLSPDLSTVTTAADVVYGLGDPLEEILHFDFQASASATKHADILVYNSLVHRLYLVPVHSIVILLRPRAAHSNLNGSVRYTARPERGKIDFGYEVVPLWQQPVEPLLTGPAEVVPLAPLAQLPAEVPEPEALAAVVRQVVERLLRETPVNKARRLLTAAYVLTGLRVPRQEARLLFQGVRAMRESDTYLAILDEGAEKEAKKFILFQGQDRFGPPSESARATLEAITDLERLEQLGRRLLHVSTWEELLQQP